jgi:two-component system cell cycle response regulator
MRILVAEDDFASRILLDAVLIKWGYEVVTANDGVAAWELLRTETAPAIAILDWMMPGLSGIELCQLLKAQNRELLPYILMLTSKGQKADVAQGLDAGADDYLVKPFDLGELGARLRVARRSLERERELIESRKAVQYHSQHDLSSGALNRSAVLSALGAQLASAQRVAVALLALDDHKLLQQIEGAEAAEAAIRGLVQRLRVHAPNAAIGRYGSDELLLLLPGASLASAVELVKLIRAEIALPAFPASVGLQRQSTISAGIAESDGSRSLELLLGNADTALDTARAIGNTVDVFDLPVVPARGTG